METGGVVGLKMFGGVERRFVRVTVENVDVSVNGFEYVTECRVVETPLGVCSKRGV